MRKNCVLIIDHDLQTCKAIKYNLKSETTEAYYTLTVQEGLTALATRDYEVVILNVCFPEIDGMELLRTLRCMKPLTKPFKTEECLAHIYALLQRFTS